MVDGTVRPDHTETRRVLTFTAQRCLDFPFGCDLVLGVNGRRPRFVGAAEVSRLQAIELVHDLVPDQDVVRNVPVPDPHATGRRGRRQALVCPAHGEAVGFAGRDVAHHALSGARRAVGSMHPGDALLEPADVIAANQAVLQLDHTGSGGRAGQRGGDIQTIRRRTGLEQCREGVGQRRAEQRAGSLGPAQRLGREREFPAANRRQGLEIGGLNLLDGKDRSRVVKRSAPASNAVAQELALSDQKS